MKKLISLSLAILLIAISFSACSQKPNNEFTQENVTKTVTTAFDALKNVDTETLETYVSSSTLSILSSYIDKKDQFKELGKAMFANLSYEIKDINLENNTVTVAVINKDLKASTEKYTKSLLKAYTKIQLLQRLNDDKWLDNNLSKLTAQIEKAQIQKEPTEITISIQQKSNNLVLVFDETAEDAVSGGAIGAIKNIA